jgi:hypothetical protein
MSHEAVATTAPAPTVSSESKAKAAYPHVVIVCGESGSGKDTVCDLLVKHNSSAVNNSVVGKVAVIVRFAMPVRRALASLTNINIARSMTDAGKKELLPRWYNATSGAFATRMGLVLAMQQLLCNLRGSQASFEDGVKAASVFTGIPLINFNEDGIPGLEILDKGLPAPHISVGRALQIIGTDIGRDMVSPQLWTGKLVKEWQEKHGGGPIRIPDGRFPSEIEDMRRACAGKFDVSVWRITGRGGGAAATGRDAAHASETSIAAIKADVEIDNSGSLEDLERAVLALGGPTFRWRSPVNTLAC